MPSCLPRLALLLCCTLCLPAGAQSVKPGLWEINNKTQSGDGKLEAAMAGLEQQMAAMGPEQRKMVQEMMAKQGVALDTAGAGVTMKICMTKEMAAQGLQVQTKGDCNTSRTQSSGNTIAIRFVCTKPPSHGEGTATMISDTAYTMAMKITANLAGKDETMSVHARGTWLGADCGAIKPLTTTLTQ